MGCSPYGSKESDRTERLSIAQHRLTLEMNDQGLPEGPVVKDFAFQYKGCEFVPWVRKVPWGGKWQSTPVFLPGEFYGQRSLVGYSPWGRKELDVTEQLTLSLSLTHTRGTGI